jgi:serine/threonine protein phosphatase PrpC
VLLICSDGLWNYRPEAVDLASLVTFPDVFTDPLAVAATLVKFAVDAGGMDNITVALIPFQAVP